MSGATGQKLDGAKPRVDLLDPDALEGIARVLAFGAKKYAAHNWRGGIAWSRLLGGALRHLFAIMRGEDMDPESGLPHVDHLGCCWMFLSWHFRHRKDLDDRWKGNAVAPVPANTGEPPSVLGVPVDPLASWAQRVLQRSA